MTNSGNKFQMHRIGAIIQARMSSQRLPGKVLHRVEDKPLLQYLLENLWHCKNLDEIIVATSSDSSDQPIIDFCKDNGLHYYCGDLQNVVSRFMGVLKNYPMEGFVRVNGDSPLINHDLIDQMIALFINGDYDLVTNVMPRSYPRGQSVEVLKTRIFAEAQMFIREQEDQEHVTRYFYRNNKDYRIYNVLAPLDYSNVYLCVDTPEHMDIFSRVVAKMKRPHWQYGIEEIIEIHKQVFF